MVPNPAITQKITVKGNIKSLADEASNKLIAQENLASLKMISGSEITDKKGNIAVRVNNSANAAKIIKTMEIEILSL